MICLIGKIIFVVLQNHNYNNASKKHTIMEELKMGKTKKLVSVVLAVGMFSAMSTCAYAQDASTEYVNDSANVPIVSSQTVEYESSADNGLGGVRSLAPVYGTNTKYYEDYDVKFGFKASVSVQYDANKGRYYMANIMTERPSVTIRPGSGASAIPSEPTWQYTDGGRTIVLQCEADVLNNTGHVDTIYPTMFIYCNGNNGALSMSEY